MNVVIPIPKDEFRNSPKRLAAVLKASIKAVRSRYFDHQRHCLKTWTYIGKELQGQYDKKESVKQWRYLFDPTGKDESKYPFSATTANRHMQIASYDFGPPEDQARLPVQYTILYELTILTPAQFKKAMDAGKIFPDMTRQQAIKLKPKSKSKKTTRKTKFSIDKWHDVFIEGAQRISDERISNGITKRHLEIYYALQDMPEPFTAELHKQIEEYCIAHDGRK